MKETLEIIGLPVWLALMVAGFIWFWPVGIAILCYLTWTERMRLFGPRVMMSPWGSGNSAFDEHRAEQLKALDQERKDFDAFLVKLASAKDKAEFDGFMSERKS